MVLDAILVLVVVAGFAGAAALAVAEVSLLRVRPSQVSAEGHRRSTDLLALLDDLPAVLNSVLFAVLLCQVAVATVSGFLAQRWVGGLWITVGSIAITVLLFIYAEALPKTWAMRAPQKHALQLAAPLRRFVRICRPVVSILTALADLQSSWDIGADPISERELRLLAHQSAEAGAIAHADAELVDRSFTFGDRVVADVMVDREDIVAVGEEVSVADALATAIAAGHRRVVVVAGGIDEVLGIVRLRDLAAAPPGAGTSVRDIMSPALFCRPSDPIANLIEEMRASGTWLAVVRDADGTSAGLATVEDVLAELMGEIEEGPPVEPT